MSRVILVVCDALRDDVAAEQMGYLELLVEQRRASRYTVVAGLPTLSRPCYETIQTGTPATEHGITSNADVRRSTMPNLFGLAHEQGKTTAAAAYGWVSELYIRAPYDPVFDREVDDKDLLIQHGRFYSDDAYPDSELFAAGARLLHRYEPDYLLIHPMGIDYIGHLHGADSREYRTTVMQQDMLLARLVPQALDLAYTVLVTGDHGMNDDHNHNGTLTDVRNVPLYVIPPSGAGMGNTRALVSQLQVAPTVCALLDTPPAETMTLPAINVR